MRNQILFYIVILLTNIIHGITGFAGTILAMPPSLMLVGYDIAKPILNVLAIFSGVYVFVGNYKKIAWKELAKIVVVMALGIFGAVFIKGLFVGKGNESGCATTQYERCIAIIGTHVSDSAGLAFPHQS